MTWTWLDILVVALGVVLTATLVVLVLTLMRLRGGVASAAQRLLALKDPTVSLAVDGRDLAGRLSGRAVGIATAAAGTYRAIRPGPVPGMPVTYSSMLRGLRDGLATLATLKTVQGHVFKKKKIEPPPGPPSVVRRPRKPPLGKRLRDGLVPPLLMPLLNNLPNIAFAVGLLRTVLDTVRKQQPPAAAD